jgi:hypothetical protein
MFFLVICRNKKGEIREGCHPKIKNFFLEIHFLFFSPGPVVPLSMMKKVFGLAILAACAEAFSITPAASFVTRCV